jgi:hypothetical protein
MSFVDEYYIQKIFYAIKNNTHHDQFGRFASSSGFQNFSLHEKGTYLTENGGKAWLKSLEVNEVNAIHHYTHDGYKEMNTLLRSGQYNPKARDRVSTFIRDATSALMKGKAPIDMMVLRAIPTKYVPQLVASKGSTFRDAGFSSTTLDTRPIRNKLLLNIHIPKGSPGAYVAPLSDAKDEEEWLLPPNARFNVHRVYSNPDGSVSADLEYIGL